MQTVSMPHSIISSSLAADAAGNIYVWDSGNYIIRRIDQSQNVTTIGGNGASGNADGSA